MIDYQIRSLHKFFKFPFRYTIFDNSSIGEASLLIRGVANKNGIGYVRLPRQEFLPNGFGSFSHGIAANYAFRNYIKDGGAKYFGLLDHDIFLVNNFDISAHLDSHQFFYGCKHRFYIWPGLWFMPMERLIDRGVDFRPSLHRHGDTGAANYWRHFRHVDWSEYHLANDVHHLLDDTENDIFSNGYSLIDGCWLHCWNASDYMHKGVDSKMQRIFAIVERKMQGEE